MKTSDEMVLKYAVRYKDTGQISLPNGVYNYEIYDSEKRLKENTEKITDWRYADSGGKLTYKTDKYGFRNEFDIDTIGDYAVALGCSITFGTAQYEHERYTTYLEQKIGMPIYNMGINASNDQVSLHNLLWLLSNFKPPKLIIFQHSGKDRVAMPSVHDENSILLCGPWVSMFNDYFKDLDPFWTLSDQYLISDLRYRMVKDQLKNACKNIKLVAFDGIKLHNTNQLDYGRDLHHCGPLHNEYMANEIFKLIGETE